MTRAEPAQDAGPMQKIVHQRIDGDHDGSGFGPENASRVSCQQETSECHRQHLVRDAVGVGERLDDSLSQPRCSIGRRSTVGIGEPPVDPANEIAVGDITHEQEEAVCRLVEPAVAQIVGRQRATREMVRLSAAPLGLLIPTMVEVPVTLQLRTGRVGLDQRCDLAPSHPAMSLHVVVSDLVADALIADRFEQPVEHHRRVAAKNGGANTAPGQVAGEPIDQERLTGDSADPRDEPGRSIELAGFGFIAQTPGSSLSRRRHSASN